MKCEYRCLKCRFFWSNYRALFHWCGLADPGNVLPDGTVFRYYGQCKDN